MLGNHPEFARCTEQLASMMQSLKPETGNLGIEGIEGIEGIPYHCQMVVSIGGFSQHKIPKSSG